MTVSFFPHSHSPVISRVFYFQPPRSHPLPSSPPLIFSASLLCLSAAPLLPQLTSSLSSAYFLFFYFLSLVHYPPPSVLPVRKCSIATQLQVSAEQPLFSPPWLPPQRSAALQSGQVLRVSVSVLLALR